MKKPYRLRQRDKGKNWEYKLPDDTCFHSTGTTRKREAENIASEKARIHTALLETGGDPTITLAEFSRDYFVYGECPWIQYSNEKGGGTSSDTAKWRVESHRVV